MARLDKWQRQRIMEAMCAAKRKELSRPTVLNDMVWQEAFGETGFCLGDGSAHIFALSRFGILHVFRRTRLDEAWLAPLIKDELEHFKALSILERRLKAKSPWRATYFQKVIVAVPTRDKDSGQLVVSFPFPKEPYRVGTKKEAINHCLRKKKEGNYSDFGREPLATRYFFEEEYIKASDLEGWLTPRKQNQSSPWVKGMTIIREKPEEKIWVPKLTNEEFKLLAEDPEGNKTYVIRELNKRHRTEINAGLLSPMVIKEAVERLIEPLLK